MKKISILAMAALFLAACNQDGQTIIEDEGGNALLFNASTNVTTTRAFSTFGSINTNALMASGDGFGVFAYHNGQTKSPAVETGTDVKGANFMFNQQVHYTGSWIYSPLKYWPNETGNKAESEDEESLSFLAYAPYISASEAESNKNGNKGGIVGISENTKAFDEIAIDYQVAQDPKQQVDLLWGVSDGKEETSYVDVEGHTVSPEGGMPLYDLTKPQVSYKVPFLFKHALSKLNLTIDAIVDAVDGNTNPVANGTKIFVRQVTFDGNLATVGTLLLKNTEANKPLWKAIGGTADLEKAPLVLNDGREKNKEASTEKDETFACLNPMIIQKGNAFGTSEVGVTNATVSLLKPAADDGTASLMVIPVPVENPDESTMKVTIVYDVLTFDENLGVFLDDDSQQRGSTVTNVITKTIEKFVFEAGKEYTINMHLGMNSVKFNATVSDWVDNGAKPVDLPSNGEASNQNTVNEQTLPGILTAAANYSYTDHTHKGTFNISGSVVNYSIAASTLQSDNDAIMNDMARMLGGLYRQNNPPVTEIEYGGNTYVWDENEPNKGSNWTSSIPCTQATSLVTAFVQSVGTAVTSTGSASVTLKLNGTTVTCNVTVTGMP